MVLVLFLDVVVVVVVVVDEDEDGVVDDDDLVVDAGIGDEKPLMAIFAVDW
jgi:hypothetical protein